MNKLLKCPFCGSEVNITKEKLPYGKFLYRIDCPGCNIHTDSFDKEKDATKIWNRRVDNGKY